MMMEEKIYTNDGEVASFPYHFEIRKDPDSEEYIGEVTAYIWKDLQIMDEQRKILQQKLDSIPTQADSGFYLVQNEVVYRSSKIISGKFDYHDQEVDIRRHFIEDYLEAERDLTLYVKEYHAVTEKTEFLN